MVVVGGLTNHASCRGHKARASMPPGYEVDESSTADHTEQVIKRPSHTVVVIIR